MIEEELIIVALYLFVFICFRFAKFQIVCIGLQVMSELKIVIQVNLPKRHLRVTATSDIRQLSELPIDIFNTKLPPSSGNHRVAAQNHPPDGCRFGRFTCIHNIVDPV